MELPSKNIHRLYVGFVFKKVIINNSVFMKDGVRFNLSKDFKTILVLSESLASSSISSFPF